jgi:hypothetical protein
MKRRALVPLCTTLATTTLGTANAADRGHSMLTGDQMLARAAASDGLRTYSVPLHFDVHMRRPIGVKVSRAWSTASHRPTPFWN